MLRWLGIPVEAADWICLAKVKEDNNERVIQVNDETLQLFKM